jgi:dienelactone hydrolase
MKMRLWILMLPLTLAGQTAGDVKQWLDQPLLDAKQGQLEVQVYTESRVPVVPAFGNSADWDRYASKLRQDMVDNVVFRGEAKKWRAAQRKIEWTNTLTGPGYRVKKLRFEVVPGLWTSAVLYEPESVSGKVPAVLNVNGHERDGISTAYIQERCINLAKKGMLAFNAEWVGRGQLDMPGFVHYKMNYLDLTGTSGLSVFYLMMERSLDILLAHENTDAARVAVTGLSGGGWQTTFITALDTRIKLSVPVAGHSSFVTRAQWPTLDLGDSEQTPSDMATVGDYLHMTALTAPRPLMLINNAKDNCCFRADYAMGPLLQMARHIYGLYGAQDKVRHYINHSNGHNYDQFSREELYRFLKEHFGGSFEAKEIPSATEVRKPAELASDLPANNETFHTLAMKLAASLPSGTGSREELAALVRARSLHMDAREVKREGNTTWWHLKIDHAWTVPAVEMGPASARETVILIADEGRGSLSNEAAAHIGQGRRVLAVDPFYVGESKIATRDFLFAILIAALGERPLGLQASQITAIARWMKQRNSGGSVQVESHGRRSSLMGVVAAALEPEVISKTELHGSLRSLNRPWRRT